MALHSTIILRGFGQTPKIVLRGFGSNAPTVTQPYNPAKFSGATDDATFSAGTDKATFGSAD